MKKILTCLLAAVFLVGSLSGCGSSGSGTSDSEYPDKIVIGTQSYVNDQQLAIAKGYFQEVFGDEMTIEIVTFNLGRDAVQAMISGDLDFLLAGAIGAVSGLAIGLGAEVIWIHELNNVSDAVVAREGSGIESLTDLEGKKVALPFVSSIHYALERGLEKSGVDINNVELLDMELQKIYAAWTNGDIDIAAVWNPIMSTLEGAKIIYTCGDSAANGFPVFALGVVAKNFAEAYPDLVVKYVQALEMAQQLKKSELSDAVATLADALEMSEADVETQANDSTWLTAEEQLAEQYLGGQMADSLYSMAMFLYEGGNLAEEPDEDIFEAAVNPSYIEQALGG